MKEIDDLNERINGVDELIDTLVKTNTEMEKRQAALEECKENFKDLGPRVKALESKTNYPEVYIPDYSKEFEQIFEQMKDSNGNFSRVAVTESFRKVFDRIDALHKDITTLSKRYFDPKTKWLLVVCSVLILLVSILTGTTIGFAIESYELKINGTSEKILGKDTVDRLPINKSFKKHKVKIGRLKQHRQQ